MNRTLYICTLVDLYGVAFHNRNGYRDQMVSLPIHKNDNTCPLIARYPCYSEDNRWAL